MNIKSSIKICNETIHPGEFISLALPLPELYSCLPAFMPIKVFNGKKAGPILLVFAAINGDELNGITIINKLISYKKLKQLNGTLILVPVVNVFGLANKSKYLPGNVLLNETFPGSKTGTHADRIAHLFLSEIFELADYAISLETGPLNHSHLPEISVDSKQEECMNAAKAFRAPIITNAKGHAKSLVEYAKTHKKNFLTYTAGESFRFDSNAITTGVKGILNLMSYLKMIPEKEAKSTKTPESVFLDSSKWIRTSFTGISTSLVKLGAHVKKNTPLATIDDPFGSNYPHSITSPSDGIIVGINNVPLVKEGEALFKLASFTGHEDNSAHLQKWDEFAQE